MFTDLNGSRKLVTKPRRCAKMIQIPQRLFAAVCRSSYEIGRLLTRPLLVRLRAISNS